MDVTDLETDADDAYEAARALAHRIGPPLPPAVVYGSMGALKGIPQALPQILTRLAGVMAGSLTVYEVGEDLREGETEPRIPVDGIAKANGHLNRAAALIAEAGWEMELAQTAIATQWHRD